MPPSSSSPAASVADPACHRPVAVPAAPPAAGPADLPAFPAVEWPPRSSAWETIRAAFAEFRAAGESPLSSLRIADLTPAGATGAAVKALSGNLREIAARFSGPTVHLPAVPEIRPSRALLDARAAAAAAGRISVNVTVHCQGAAAASAYVNLDGEGI